MPDPMSALELKLNRELLRYSIVSHPTFVCPISGAMLDVRRSVLLTVETPTNPRPGSIVLDGPAFDDLYVKLVADAAPGTRFEVWDGRLLNSRAPAKQALGYRLFVVPEPTSVAPQAETLF